MSNLSMDDVIHHMTLALDHFYDAQLYTGMTSIIIGNGKTLEITHIGIIRLKTPSGLLDLKNVLCPFIEREIYLYSMLSRDMKCDFLLNESGFVVLDKVTRRK